MEYYYTSKDKIDFKKNELLIDNFEYKHLTKVLRKKVGDKVTITDGERNIYYCEISKIDKTKIICDILHKDFNLYEPKINLSLFLSPLRNLSRFEFAIEKAVELGVNSIHTVITEYTVNKSSLNKSKLDRLNKIIIGAMGQSQRSVLPMLYNVISFSKMINTTADVKNKVVMYEFSDNGSEFRYDKSSNDISLLIGPEGGFSKDEISTLIRNNWQVKSLGERKIRAETAVIVSVFEFIQKTLI